MFTCVYTCMSRAFEKEYHELEQHTKPKKPHLRHKRHLRRRTPEDKKQKKASRRRDSRVTENRYGIDLSKAQGAMRLHRHDSDSDDSSFWSDEGLDDFGGIMHAKDFENSDSSSSDYLEDEEGSGNGNEAGINHRKKSSSNSYVCIYVCFLLLSLSLDPSIPRAHDADI